MRELPHTNPSLSIHRATSTAKQPSTYFHTVYYFEKSRSSLSFDIHSSDRSCIANAFSFSIASPFYTIFSSFPSSHLPSIVSRLSRVHGRPVLTAYRRIVVNHQPSILFETKKSTPSEFIHSLSRFQDFDIVTGAKLSASRLNTTKPPKQPPNSTQQHQPFLKSPFSSSAAAPT